MIYDWRPAILATLMMLASAALLFLVRPAPVVRTVVQSPIAPPAPQTRIERVVEKHYVTDQHKPSSPGGLIRAGAGTVNEPYSPAPQFREAPPTERAEAPPLEADALPGQPDLRGMGALERVPEVSVSEPPVGGREPEASRSDPLSPDPVVTPSPFLGLLLNPPALQPLEQPTDYGSRWAAGVTFSGIPLTTYDLWRGEIAARLPLLGRKRVTTWGAGWFVSGQEFRQYDGGPQGSIGTRIRIGLAVPLRESWQRRQPVFWGFASYAF